MIQRLDHSTPRIQPCHQDAVTKSQYVAWLNMKNEQLMERNDVLTDRIHEALAHAQGGDTEAVLETLRAALKE